MIKLPGQIVHCLLQIGAGAGGGDEIYCGVDKPPFLLVVDRQSKQVRTDVQMDGHRALVGSLVQTSPKEIWSASWDGSIRIWNTSTHECVRMLHHSADSPQPVVSLCLVNGRRHVWSSSVNSIYVWDLSGLLLHRIRLEPVDGSSNLLSAVAMCPGYQDAVWCAVGEHALVYPSEPAAAAAAAERHRAGDDEPVEFVVKKIVIGHRARIKSLMYVADHLTMVSGDALGTICAWDAVSLLPLKVIENAHQGPVFCLLLMSFLVNDQSVYEVWSGGHDRLIRCWDPESFHCMNELGKGPQQQQQRAAAATKIPLRHSLTSSSPSSSSSQSQSPSPSLGSSASGQVLVRQPRTSAIYHMIAVGNSSKVWSGGDELIEVWDHAQVSSPKLHIIGYKNGDKYVGEAGRLPETGKLVRHGQGELHAADGQRYVGHWRKDCKSGFGVLVYKNKDRFYGYFKRDEQHGTGTLIYTDGTVFQGVWKQGKRKGLGQLWLPNGDQLSGEWTGSDVVKAVYRKGTLSDVSECSRRLFAAAVDETRRKEEHAATRRKRDVHLIPAQKWLSFQQIAQTGLLRDLQQSVAAAATSSSAVNSNALSVMLSDPSHLLGQVVNDFVFYFKAAYHFSYGSVDQLLFNCKDDIHSFVKQLNNICSPAFEGKVKKKECLLTIRELVTAKCFRSTFELMCRVYQTKNTLIQVKIDSLRTITLAEIGVKPEFWLGWTADGQGPVQQPYQSAVGQLRQLSKFSTVSRKLACLIHVSNSILSAVDEFYTKKKRRGGEGGDDDGGHNVGTEDDDGEEEDDGGDIVMGTEDKFPILSFILIQARVPNIYAELAFIRSFADESQLRDEAEYRLMEIEMALEYVSTLDWNVVDEAGVIVPLRSLESRVENALATAVSQFSGQQKPPKTMWLAEALLMLGTRRRRTPSSSSETPSLVLTDVGDSFAFLSPASDDEAAAYFEMGQTVFAVLGLKLVRRSDDDDAVVVVVEHEYPLHIYIHISNLIELKNKKPI